MFSFRRKPGKSPKRKLVIFCGLLRTYKTALPSFFKHIVETFDADVLFVCPTQTGGIASYHSKTTEFDTAETSEPHADVDYLMSLSQRRMIDQKIFDYKSRVPDTLSDLSPFCGISIGRIASFFYNFKLAFNDLDLTPYDLIILTRPDLAIYRKASISIDLDLEDTVFFNVGEGFDEAGRRKLGCAPVFPFVNTEIGVAISQGDMTFNDQIIVGRPNVLKNIADIYDRLEDYVTAHGVPPTPETLIVYHMHLVCGFKIKAIDFTTHEILRTNTPMRRSAYLGGYDYYHKK